MNAPAAPEIDGLTYLEHLGSGGYSDVFLYERRLPRMRVAVKVLKDGRLSGSELAQFAAEAETMAELADHPYIVQVFSTGTTEDGRPFLVMKYYPPPNLGVRAGQERFSVAEVLRTGVRIASAVETAHRAGILHRDIKPANILVDQYGAPGLTDFGIAGHAADTDAGDDLGVSIPWSPPEVLSGASNGSPQSDVYSLGATVWHLLVGRSPFEIPAGDNLPRALLSRVLATPPPATGRADVPPALDRLLQHAMAKNPALRPRTALEFAQALQAVEQEQRLVRTEIVVDGIGRPAVGSADRPTRPAAPGDTDSTDGTRLRAARVVAQPARPSPFAAPPTPHARVVASEPTTTARPGVPARPEPPTTARPVSAPVAPAQQMPRRERAAALRDYSEPTALRPATPEAPEPAPGPSRRGLKKAHVAVAGATAVLAAIVLAAIITTHGSGNRTPQGNVPTMLATDQTALPTPTLIITPHYDARKQTIHFAWTAAPATPGASYTWKLADDATEHRTTKASADVQTANPSTTCIEVSIVVNGAGSSYSQPVCGR